LGKEPGKAMTSSQLGLVCLFLFAVGQGARDALFGNVFQSTSFWAVAAIAFAISSSVFTAWSVARGRGDIAKIIARPYQLAMLSLTTAAAWLSFFYGLRYLEPAVVATIFNGIGPLTVLFYNALGLTTKASRLSSFEKLLYVGLALSLAALATAVLTGNSGFSTVGMERQAGAIALVAMGGAMITTSYVYTKAFTDDGVGSDAVMGARFMLMCVIAASAEFLIGTSAERPSLDAIPFLALATFGLIVVPSFLVQFCVSRTSPLAANVFRTLGPVFVFSVQQADDRLSFSGPTLACVMAFCVFTIAASIIRGWQEAHGISTRRAGT